MNYLPNREAIDESLDSIRNVEAEQSVIASLLFDNAKFPAVLEILQANDFFREAHGHIFRAMADLYLRGVPVDGVTLATEMEYRGLYRQSGGDEYLRELCLAIPHAENAVFHAGIVAEKARIRNLVETATNAIGEARRGMATSQELIEETLTKITLIDKDPGDDLSPEDLRLWPEPLADAAKHGIIGEFLRIVDPHTEADPAAILFQLLAAIGNMVGRNPFWRVESTNHHLNIFTCITGLSSKARKGTSYGHIEKLSTMVDPEWARHRQGHGYTSGEGLIMDIADDYTRGGSITPGVADKRLFWVASEFASVLTVMSREGNTLSALLRQLWDGSRVAGKSKNTALSCEKPHVSIAGHVTIAEVNSLLTATESANGFGNRFLWVCARRSKLLPHGGNLRTEHFEPVAAELQRVLDFARYQLGDGIPLMRHREANRLWEQVYPTLSAGRPGLLGAMTSRAEAQVMRLAALYAVLDRTPQIFACHLQAALACWDYCEASARFIFGSRLGDSDGEKILRSLGAAGDAGLSSYQIRRKVFGGHTTKEHVDAVLTRLMHHGLVMCKEEKGANGKKLLVWRTDKEELGKEGINVETCALARLPESEDVTEETKAF